MLAVAAAVGSVVALLYLSGSCAVDLPFAMWRDDMGQVALVLLTSRSCG